MSEIRYIQSYESPLGSMTMASDGSCLTGLWFDGQKYDRAVLQGKEVILLSPEDCPEEKASDAAEVFLETVRWLDLYFGKTAGGQEGGFSMEAAELPDFLPPLKVEGSEFRQLIAELLLEIPCGSTGTYGELAAEAARRMGRSRMSAQAAGGAVGHNPISVIIPCHRVVGAGGKLTGYAGGLERKQALLKLEKCIKNKRK